MKKDTYSVALIGFGENELMALSSVFELSSRRSPKYTKHLATDTRPDIYMVDADDVAAMKRFGEVNSGGQTPSILIGASNQGTRWPVLPRPIRWMKLFRAFDESVMPTSGTPPAPPPVAPAVQTSAVPSSVAPSPSVTPASLANPIAPAVQPVGVAVAATQASQPAPLRPLADWVLVVDDNQTVREFMKSKLTPFNFNVDYAESGEQAIGFTGQKNYACIFLDVVMPGIDGYKVCKLIKSNRSARKTAVVMLTSKDSPFDKIRGSMSGCDAYLTKPVDEEKLLETISKFLPQP
ncbi:MAG: response regulator [Gallionella sp.]